MKKTFVLIFLLILVTFVDTSAQCAMCRASVGSNLSEGRGVIGTGINYGILYLLSTPYLLVAALFLVWYRTSKKELKEKLELKARIKSIYK
jgi:high-affinity nickel permease